MPLSSRPAREPGISSGRAKVLQLRYDLPRQLKNPIIAAMAGFAVVMTLLFFGVVGVVGASIASVCLFFYAQNRVRLTGREPRVVVLTAAAPFLAFLWLIAAFVLHVLISNSLAHQDCGFGLSPDPWVRLPNGYVLGSHNTYDGYIAAPGVETDMPFAGPGYVRGIWTIEWKGPYFLGTHFDGHGTRAFVYDTRTQKTTMPDPDLDTNDVTEEGRKNLDAWIAAQTQTHFDADSYWVMYTNNRSRWPNYVFLALVLLGEGGIGFRLWRIWSGSSMNAIESTAQPNASL